MAIDAATQVTRLELEVVGAASAAGALDRLENQITRETEALADLGTALERAHANLKALGDGAVDARAVAAFQAQENAVERLEQQIYAARLRVQELSNSASPPAMLVKAKEQAADLAAKLDAAKLKLEALGQNTGAKVDVAAYQKQADAIAKMTRQAGAARDKIAALSEGLGGAEGPAKKAQFSMDALKNATGKLGGSMGPAGSAALELGESLGKLGLVAGVALVAVALLAAIFAALAAAIYKALVSSDAARTEFLSLQGALEGDAAAATELQAAINAVSAASALGRDKIGEYARELGKAGLRGAELQRALEAAAIAGSAGGEELARTFLKEATAAKKAGQSVDALADKIKKQYGGIAARQALALSVQMSKLGENISALFGGAEIEPFLAALADMLSLFSQSTQLGQQLREVLGKAMSDFFAGAALVLPYVKEGIVGALLVAVKLYIYFKKLSNALSELGGGSVGIDGMTAALWAGKIAAWAVVSVVALIAAGLALLFGPIAALVAAFVWVVQAIGRVGSAIWETFAGIDLSGIASGMIDGLIAGITGSIGAVVAAVTSLANSAVSAMKAALDMHSPSRIFRYEIAEEGIGGALTAGLDDSSKEVDDSVAGLVDPKSVKATAKGGRAGGGGRVLYLEIHNLHLANYEEFRAWLDSQFEVEELDGSPA